MLFEDEAEDAERYRKAVSGGRSFPGITLVPGLVRALVEAELANQGERPTEDGKAVVHGPAPLL